MLILTLLSLLQCMYNLIYGHVLALDCAHWVLFLPCVIVNIYMLISYVCITILCCVVLFIVAHHSTIFLSSVLGRYPRLVCRGIPYGVLYLVGPVRGLCHCRRKFVVCISCNFGVCVECFVFVDGVCHISAVPQWHFKNRDILIRALIDVITL
jgi:hypothetical protein